MPDFASLIALSKTAEAILHPPFEWCVITGGVVTLEDATSTGGTKGGEYHVTDFASAKFPITNAQYQKFLDHPSGYATPNWWQYSSEAVQWRKDHPNLSPTAFDGADLPRTRVSWFDAMAFCHWLSVELAHHNRVQLSSILKAHDPTTWSVRLPTEQEWQRAAIGDTGWLYPWGNRLDETRGNYARQVGLPRRVGSYPAGKSPYEVLDLIGNVWEWCLTAWDVDGIDVSGYAYRHIRGGAWNVSNPNHLRAIDRGGNSPRGRLNDAGFRCAYFFQS
jgi:formylglycine-generating enzyme required for sulfatase activity